MDTVRVKWFEKAGHDPDKGIWHSGRAIAFVRGIACASAIIEHGTRLVEVPVNELVVMSVEPRTC